MSNENQSIEEVEVTCPYCGELVEIVIEDDLKGEMVWDCEVCCRPWSLTIWSAGLEKRIEARTLDD